MQRRNARRLWQSSKSSHRAREIVDLRGFHFRLRQYWRSSLANRDVSPFRTKNSSSQVFEVKLPKRGYVTVSRRRKYKPTPRTRRNAHRIHAASLLVHVASRGSTVTSAEVRHHFPPPNAKTGSTASHCRAAEISCVSYRNGGQTCDARKTSEKSEPLPRSNSNIAG